MYHMKTIQMKIIQINLKSKLIKYYIMNIFLLYKPSGMTSKDFADIIKKKENLQKICFCGRLDPLARGKMLLLGDSMCKKMNNYINLEKVYQFEICIGYKTDTDDPMGIIQEINTDIDITTVYDLITNYIKNMNMNIYQKFHKYSSIIVDGKPMWLHSMENKIIENPKHMVSIKKIKFIKKIVRNFDIFKNSINNIISSIPKKHNFRQELIINQWNNIICSKIYSIKFEFTVTSGFYIRQFIRDLSDAINIPLMVYDINRTKIIIK